MSSSTNKAGIICFFSMYGILAGILILVIPPKEVFDCSKMTCILENNKYVNINEPCKGYSIPIPDDITTENPPEQLDCYACIKSTEGVGSTQCSLNFDDITNTITHRLPTFISGIIIGSLSLIMFIVSCVIMSERGEIHIGNISIND